MNLHKPFKKVKKRVVTKIKSFIYRINSNIFDKEYSEKLIKSKKWFETVNFNLKYLTIPPQSLIEAARCEKRFKNWCRQWKINLIEKFNPE